MNLRPSVYEFVKAHIGECRSVPKRPPEQGVSPYQSVGSCLWVTPPDGPSVRRSVRRLAQRLQLVAAPCAAGVPVRILVGIELGA